MDTFVVKHHVDTKRFTGLTNRSWSFYSALTTLEDQLADGTTFVSIMANAADNTVSVWVELPATDFITAHNEASRLITEVLDASGSWATDDESGWGCAA